MLPAPAPTSVAADALHLFAGACGGPTPLTGLLDLPSERRFVQMEDTQP
jgi:hypothetical protein